MTTHPHEPVTFGQTPLRIEDVLALANRQVPTHLQDDAPYRERIAKGARFLDSLLDKEGVIYGVTTGYGDSCVVAVPLEHVEALPRHLYTFHGCGLGKLLDAQATRAVLAARLQSLCHGVSGVRIELLERLQAFIAHDILPLIPEEGSVGASGDLTPLSYVAATLSGEREVLFKGERRFSLDVHRELGWTPLVLRPKEALALMNGTAVMTGLACLAYARADYLLKLATRITALNVVALQGNPEHFDERLFAAKPHPGQMQVAAWIRQDLAIDAPTAPLHRLQDRYSLRCAPHVLGVLADSLNWLRSFIEIELNSANDNPIIDAEEERVLHGGHFYGGHIAFAMDSLKTLVANVADLLDRQLALLVDVRYNHGLPSNLSGATAERAMLNHGFKAVQIGTSAWTAEALKNTMPASVFSRSTECHNQDKVSMGTIAARDAIRVLELTEQVAAWIRQDLAIDAPTAPLHRLQDRYSLRCAPHVLGVLADSLNWLRSFIEIELNSANDNPIIDAEEERVLHGGHFYGGHIAFAMDSLKTLVANVADLLDRQLALLVDVRYNHGLPSNLSGASAERAMLNHGFKAVQIGTSAWTAEALKNTLPASVFSRSTECHNQDKVSMGTIAARDAIRVLELTEQVAAATLLAANQGVWLRSRAEDARPLPPALAAMHAELAKDFPPVVEDRALERELRLCLSRIAQQHWRLHA